MDSSSIHLSIAHCTEKGHRESNQDFIGFSANEHLGCLVLADGAGGHAGGAEASQAVVHAVLHAFQASPTERATNATWPIAVARDALAAARTRHPDCTDMNTTLAVLLLNTDTARATWCQLGDSRIYLFRNGRAHQLSHDHSVLQAMIDAGYAQGDTTQADTQGEVKDKLRGRPARSALYAAVGSPDTPPNAVCETSLVITPGDVFLLCSDGFWGMLPEALMEQTLREASTPEQWLQRMFAHIAQPIPDIDAYTNPDLDNYSAITVWAGPRIEITRILQPGQPHPGQVAWQT